jgi:hypothetical protein
MDEYAEAKKDHARMKLTQVSNTRWHETCPYQCLVADVVPLSLQSITMNVLSLRRGGVQKWLKSGEVEL